MSSGSAGLGRGVGGQHAVGMAPALRPAWVSPFSSGLCFLSLGGATEEGALLHSLGGALSPGNLWTGRYWEASLPVSRAEPGSEAAGGPGTGR